MQWYSAEKIFDLDKKRFYYEFEKPVHPVRMVDQNGGKFEPF